MNRIIFTLGIWLFPAACTALGAAGVFLLRRQTRPATRRILCGMAAGIMLAASVWSLLLPAIARSQGRAAWVPPALGLILGAVGLLRLEDAAGQLLDLYYTAKDVSADLIGRLDGYDTNDAELDEIEQRIDLIYKLKRKYGDTVEDIIAFGKAAREELDRMDDEQFRLFMRYHLATCERPDLLGVTSHALDIFQK